MRKTVLLLLVLFLVVPTSVFAETQYDTGHFTIEIPDAWIGVSSRFYGEKIGSASGGMLIVSEVEFQVHSDEVDQETIYKSFADGVINNDACLEELSRMTIDIDGSHKAIIVSFTQELNGKPETCLAALYHNEYSALSLTYVNSSSDDDYNEFVNIVEGVHYHAEEPSVVHHFGSKHVAVRNWKVIYQYDTPCLLVEYEWYHTEDKPIAFSYSISTEVYQDGVQCMPYLWLDGEENDYLKIQKNTNLTCYEVFILNNATSPVTLYVDSMFDFSDRYDDAVYQFDIAR